jgi:hypothetical protein
MRFSEILASLRRVGPDWSAEVPVEWTQGRTIFGGLQAALLVRAMRGVVGEVQSFPLRSLQVTFVGPVPGGEVVRLRPQRLRSGRTATHAQCDLYVGEQLTCTAVAIFGAARPSRVAIEIPRLEVSVDPESLKAMPHVPGITPPFLQHMELRWAPTPPRDAANPGPRSIIFARLHDPGCTAEELLIALADSIPTPAATMVRPQPPLSSLNWMIELLGDPANLDRSDWSVIGTHVRAGCDGYLSQTSVLWGPNRHAFSVSHQTVAIFG